MPHGKRSSKPFVNVQSFQSCQRHYGLPWATSRNLGDHIVFSKSHPLLPTCCISPLTRCSKRSGHASPGVTYALLSCPLSCLPRPHSANKHGFTSARQNVSFPCRVRFRNLDNLTFLFTEPQLFICSYPYLAHPHLSLWQYSINVFSNHKILHTLPLLLLFRLLISAHRSCRPIKT